MSSAEPPTLRKEERFVTIADAVAVVETFAEQMQQRHVRIQQPKLSNKSPSLSFSSNVLEDSATSTPTSSAVNVVMMECENAPACKWFVRLSFVKGEKRWKISSMNVEHHKSHCQENKRAIDTTIDTDSSLGFAASISTEQLLASANASAAAALTAAGDGEAAAAMGASVYAGMIFVSWKETIAAIRVLAHQMGRRAVTEKATQMDWRGKSVMARRVLCQNYRNSHCGWMVVLEESSDGSDQYTVLSMSLLHSKECLETCNFNARTKDTSSVTEAGMKTDGSLDTMGLTPGGSLSTSMLVDDTSKYQLTHEMRWISGKDATKAISDFALVIQRKRSKLCKRNNGGSNKKYVCSDEQCLWFVQLVKGWKSKTWKISAMNLKHSDTCTGEAKPTARQLAEMRFFRQAVITHSKASGRLLTDNFLTKSETGIQIPKGMAYRAQRMVVAASTDDLTESYKFIPSLMESFAKKNPGSIVSYEKDALGHFVRAFIMPNTSTAVVANYQEIFGIHVFHYDTVSYQGCMALLVARDGSFDYQALAFALLPTSEIDHMKWFLTLAKRGGARFDGVPVFCSHTEHNLIRALAHEAHQSKIMFCVRSLLQEMARDKNIPALGPLEEKVWELQQHETEEAFYKTLGDIEGLNHAAAAFLRAVHPKNWAYYANRTVKLYRWTSTGADEAVIGSDIQRCDEAPFDLMYTFLAFLMDGIFKRSQVATKLLAVEGQTASMLTPGADVIYRQELQAAAGYTVRRCDEQVAFAWLTGARPKVTYRMDLALRSCTCGLIFQLGLPCRHYIAASMHFGNEAALLDSFDFIYKSSAYGEVHRNLRIEIPAAGDLHKDQSLRPALSTRNKKYKKRRHNAESSVCSTLTETSVAVLSAVSSAMSISAEEVLTPLAKTPRLDFNTDDVNSLSEIV